MLGQKGKSITSKTDNTIRGNKPEGTSKRRKTKKISRQDKTIQKKTGHSKTTKKKKILPASRGRFHEDIPTTG